MSYPAHKIANDDANDKEPHALPHNLEVEQGLLGQLLVNNASIDRVADILEPFHFYHPVHSRIYDAILKTVERGDIASPLRLKKYFENESALEAVGGTAYLVDLATASFPFASSEDYARQIFELFQARALIAQCEETRYKAYNQTIDSTVQDLIEEHETHLYTLAESGVAKKDAVSFKDSITEAIRMAEVAYNRGGAVSGVTTGLTELDRMTGGMHPTDLLILAGRPSMGKTALATNIAFNAAKKHLETGGREGAAVGLFSLEMGHAQITTRILGDLCGVSSDAMRKGAISHEDFKNLVEVGQNYKDLPFYTDDTAALS
ncbi:MAG: replicative DNA helicase, partial [Micavibrio aeruginosavorus]